MKNIESFLFILFFAQGCNNITNFNLPSVDKKIKHKVEIKNINLVIDTSFSMQGYLTEVT